MNTNIFFFFFFFQCFHRVFSQLSPFTYLPDLSMTFELMEPETEQLNINNMNNMNNMNNPPLPPEPDMDVETLKGMRVMDYLYGGVIGPKKLKIKNWNPPKTINKYKDHVDRGEFQMAATRLQSRIVPSPPTKYNPLKNQIVT